MFDHQAIDSEEDEFFTEFSRQRDQRESQPFAPVSFTFEDFYERAMLLANMRSQ